MPVKQQKCPSSSDADAEPDADAAELETDAEPDAAAHRSTRVSSKEYSSGR